MPKLNEVYDDTFRNEAKKAAAYLLVLCGCQESVCMACSTARNIQRILSDTYHQHQANKTGKPVYVGPDNLNGGSHWVYPHDAAAPDKDYYERGDHQ